MIKCKNIIYGPLAIVILNLWLKQIQYIFLKVEAKSSYMQHFGDIYDNNDLNDNDDDDGTNRYGNSYNPQQRKRGEKQRYQQQYRYAAPISNNKQIIKPNRNNWDVADNLEEDFDYNQTIPNKHYHDASGERNQHKCRIWIPEEAFSKYPSATVIQTDKAQKSKYIEICCPGYGDIRWLGNTLCRPLCENCRNGLCVEPGKCECYDGYVTNDNGDCVFTCPLGCLNGRCYLDGSCQCDPGYKLDETRKFCRPICSQGCGSNPLVNCTEPELCGCIKGYILNGTGCVPLCQPECGIGGVCRKPNVCDCSSGYRLIDGVCQSDCYQKCNYGVCYSRNRCICNPGYTYHEHSTMCIPK